MVTAKECEQTSQSLAGQPHGGDLLDRDGNCKGCGNPPAQHEVDAVKAAREATKNRRAGRRPKSASTGPPWSTGLSGLGSSLLAFMVSSLASSPSYRGPHSITESGLGSPSSSSTPMLSEEDGTLNSQIGTLAAKHKTM